MVPEKELTIQPLLRDRITAALRELIEEKRADHLVRIESERDLATRLNVSRLSVRFAIQALVSEGLLVTKHGSGTYIVPYGGPRIVNLIAAPDLKPHDPFYNEFLSEFSRYLGEQSIQLRMLHLDQLPARPTKTPLIVVGLVDNELMHRLRALHSTVVATQSYPDSAGISQICFDDYRIGSEAGSILYNEGHRRILHLAGPAIYASSRERRSGFQHRLQSLGVDAELLEGKMNWRSGYELGETVVDRTRQRKPISAVFAANDWMALGLMQRVRESGIRIPDELSVIGCDDIHLASEAKPHLATFRWDMPYLIKELFAHLRMMEKDGESPHRRVLLPAQFIRRESLRTIDP